MTWDRILGSVPIDRTARSVTERTNGLMPVGPKPEENRMHWTAPPPCLPVPPQAPSLIGIVFGRFRVIGYLGKTSNRKHKGRWLVRCQCGDYETRSARAIRASENAHDRCQNCQHHRNLTRRDTGE